MCSQILYCNIKVERTGPTRVRTTQTSLLYLWWNPHQNAISVYLQISNVHGCAHFRRSRITPEMFLTHQSRIRSDAHIFVVLLSMLVQLAYRSLKMGSNFVSVEVHFLPLGTSKWCSSISPQIGRAICIIRLLVAVPCDDNSQVVSDGKAPLLSCLYTGHSHIQ